MTNILIIGAGLIGHRHVQAVDAHPGCTLVGIVDPNPPELTTQAPVFPDLVSVDVAQDVSVDGAIIASPTQLHLEHATFCAGQGWDVLIEKPIASSQADAEALVKATQNVRTLMGHHRRHHGNVAALKAMIDAGDIGRPVTCSVLWNMKKPDSYFETTWRKTAADPVQMNLVHDIDLLQHLFGPVAEAQVMAGNPIRGDIRPESGVVSLRFENSMFASLTFADTTPSPWGFEAGTGENPTIGTTGQDMMFIAGTAGAVSYPSLTQWGGSDTWTNPVTATQHAVQKTHALTAQLDHFLDVIEGRATSRNTATEGAATLQLIADIHSKLDSTLVR